MEVDLQSFFGSIIPLYVMHVMCKAVFTGWDSATPPSPRIVLGLVYEGAIGQQR